MLCLFLSSLIHISHYCDPKTWYFISCFLTVCISPFTCYFHLVPMVLIGHDPCGLLCNWPESDCKHFCVKLVSNPSTLNETGGSMLLQNVYISLPVCMASQQEHNCKLCTVKIYYCYYYYFCCCCCCCHLNVAHPFVSSVQESNECNSWQYVLCSTVTDCCTVAATTASTTNGLKLPYKLENYLFIAFCFH